MISIATLSEAVQALRAGNRDESRAILDEILKQDPNHRRALLWRAGVGTTAEESKSCITLKTPVPDTVHGL